MTMGIQTIIYPVKDLAKAKAVYGALLGAAPVVDSPYYVGYNVAGQDIGLDPNGHNEGMTAYWHVADIEASIAALVAAGAAVLEPAKNVGGGRLIASMKDADGNLIGLLQNP